MNEWTKSDLWAPFLSSEGQVKEERKVLLVD